jgi:SAM-dependent methyltransferase
LPRAPESSERVSPVSVRPERQNPGVYSDPVAYEVGFSYRDVEAEVDALLAWHDGPVATALEIASGPGDHALELARRGIGVAVLDLSPQMCARVVERFADAGMALREIAQADMIDFKLGDQFDLIFCLIDSLAHVLTLDDLVRHLTCVRDHLSAAGAYVVETLHPADGFRPGSRTDIDWTAERDGVRVRIRWGDGDEVIDPITQITNVRVSIEVTRPGGGHMLAEMLPQRFWTRDELAAAARLADLEVTAVFGDFADSPLDGPHAWRMITVLRPARYQPGEVDQQ